MKLLKELELKDYISMLLGIITFFIALALRNNLLEVKNYNLSIILVIFLASVLYGLVAVAIWGLQYFIRLYLFFTLTAAVTAISSPFILIGFKVYNHYNKEKEVIIEKSNNKINFIVDSCDCKKIKYGIFSLGKDTIYRYKTDSGDFYNVKYANLSIMLEGKKIIWINDCEYRINYEINNSYGIYHLGRIFKDSCDMKVIRHFGVNIEEEYVKMKIVSIK